MRARSTSVLLVWVALVALVGLGLAACGGDDDGGKIAIRPFREVQVGDLRFEADPSVAGQAVFHVTTSRPMICAIVWGETDAFGRFNNTMGMAGTGVTQHDVLLPDVTPGRDYRFVVQGTTADGTLYRSDTGIFSVPALPEGTSPASGGVDAGSGVGTNLALGATVTEVSSEFSAAFAAANAIDGDLGSEWATRGDGDAGSLTVDLGAVRDVSGTAFLTRSMADGSAVTQTYTVQVDGGASFGPYPAGSARAPRPATFDTRGRVFRFDVEASSGGNVGAIEVRVLARD